MTRWRQLVGLASVGVLLLMAAPARGADAPSQSSVTVTATVRINPLAVEFDVPYRPPRAGQRIRLDATVRNLGSDPVDELVATLRISEAAVEVADGVERQLGTLAGGRQTRPGWQVCTESPGSYIVLVRVEGILSGQMVVAESPSRVLTFSPPPGRRPASC